MRILNIDKETEYSLPKTIEIFKTTFMRLKKRWLMDSVEQTKADTFVNYLEEIYI